MTTQRNEVSTIGRRRGLLRPAIATLGICGLSMLPQIASAQILDFAPKPALSTLDHMKVDLKGGQISRSMGGLSIGPQDSPALDFGIFATSFLSAGRTPLLGEKNRLCQDYSGITCVYHASSWSLNGETDIYYYSPSSYNPLPGFSARGLIPGYLRDGTQVLYDQAVGATRFAVSQVIYPNGETLTYNYSGTDLRSIVSNTGYMLHFSDYGPYAGSPPDKYPSKVVLINLKTDYCDPLAATCTGLTVNWPSMSYSGSGSTSTGHTIQATDNMSRVWTSVETHSPVTVPAAGLNEYTATFRLTTPAGRWMEYRRRIVFTSVPPPPAGTGCTTKSILQWVKTAAGQWDYSFGTGSCGSTSQTTGVNGVSTGPDGFVEKWDSGFVDPLNRKTSYTENGFSALFGSITLNVGSVTLPEGNLTQFGYDERRNLASTTVTAKSGGATLSASAWFPATSTCTVATVKTCNKPDYTIDANGNRTDYTYSSTHGGVLNKILPPDNNGIRPQVTYRYAQRSALYKNSSGALVPGSPIYKIIEISTCRSGASCTGTDQEIITAYGYDENLLINTETVKTGTGAVLSVTTTTYDPVGNVTSVDGPVAGAVDTVYFFYDDARRNIGEIGIDPDGAGPLPRPARKFSHNLDGQVTTVQTGTANGTTLAHLNAMSVNGYVETQYDDLGRASRRTIVAGGVTQSVTQMSYDVRNRLVCTALRMNPSAYGSLPSDPCSPGTSGAYGPDRITKNVYDAAGELTQIVQGYGTVDQRAYATYSYSNNGLPLNSIDANGNRTYQTYDGFDRLSYTYYPSSSRPTAFDPSTPATALATAGAYNTGDYESFGYDNNGNRTSWRRRDGNVIGYTYDKLNRETLSDLPGGGDKDVYTGYDLLGNVLYKRFGSTSGAGVSYVYDDLGRITSTTDMNGRTVGYQYDAASARTRLTFPDNNFIGYTPDNASRLTQVGWNALSGLFSQSYDSFGRLSAVTKGSGATSYTFNASGRLGSMTNDFSGTGNDITWTFSSYNPAGQLVVQEASSELYDYAETAFSTTDSSYDGLNRDSAIAALAGGYDARGNVTRDGTRTFAYDVENRLLTASGGSADLTLTYDPEGRIASYKSGATQTTFLYDGIDLIAEYSGTGAVLRRYVHSTAIDDPVVWLEGAGANDARFFYKNYQGSVIAYSNSQGDQLERYKYGPYGEPKSASDGESWSGARFRYTGQLMLSEGKLYHYKARVYDPAVGRFLQMDPVGSEDDLNRYAYVGGDPINFMDPMGDLKTCAASFPDIQEQVQIDGATTTAVNVPGPRHINGEIVCAEDGEEKSDTEEVIVTAKKNKSFDNVAIDFHGDEQFFSATPGGITGIAPAAKWDCGTAYSYTSPKLSAFGDGAIGHTHAPASGSHGVLPQFGPDDGLAAQAKGVAYVMSPVGIMRVTRRGANNYAATLVDGKWGESESSVKARLGKWNRYDGKMGPQALGKGNGKCNQIY